MQQLRQQTNPRQLHRQVYALLDYVLALPTADGTYYSNELITFSATVSDTEDAPDELVVRWSSSVDGELDLGASPDSTGLVEGFGYLTEAEHAVTVEVGRGEGGAE